MDVEKYWQTVSRPSTLGSEVHTLTNQLGCLAAIEQRYTHYLTLLEQLPSGVNFLERVDTALELLAVQKKSLEEQRKAKETQHWDEVRAVHRARFDLCLACTEGCFQKALQTHRMVILVGGSELEVDEPEMINVPEHQCKCAQWVRWLVEYHCVQYNDTRCALRMYPCTSLQCHACENRVYTTNLQACNKEPLFTAANDDD
jgi:hypothetical protein